MALLKITLCGEPVLRQRAKAVHKVTREVRKLAADMLETMRDSRGIGLAAPQVGVLKRLFVAEVPEHPAMLFIDPEIVFMGSETSAYKEGCLSIPGFEGEVVRPERIIVQALDEKGERFQLEASGLLSRCIQHEIDHLDGILFPDRMGEAGKALIREFLAGRRKVG
ncbi:peptide deformylase [bacterium]|nr:peptide deformylase [bacterium]